MFMQNRHPLLFNALNKVDSRKKQETYLIQETTTNKGQNFSDFTDR